MLQTFSDRFTPDLRDDAQTHGLTPYQALTLASIVEREAVIPAERPVIAGVFYNRLAADDLLGADPPCNSPSPWTRQCGQVRLLEERTHDRRPGEQVALQHAPRRRPAARADHESRPRLDQGRGEPQKRNDYYFVADAKKGDGSHVFAETAGRARREHRRRTARHERARPRRIIGHPVGHSLSPVFQAAAFAACGLDITYEPGTPRPEALDGPARKPARARLPRRERHHPAQRGGHPAAR